MRQRVAILLIGLLALGACGDDSADDGASTPSARGVTADAVKVGFAIVDLKSLAAQGIKDPYGLRQDAQQVLQALVDDVNADGGVNGRRIDPVFKKVDFLDPNAQRAACLAFVQDDAVFGVVDTFAFSRPDTQGCLAAENKTPVVSASPGTDAELAKNAPYLVSLRKSETRTLKDLVLGAKEEGFFDAAKGFKKLGIVSHACRQELVDGPAGLKRLLADAGVAGTLSNFQIDCTLQGEQSIGEAAVLRHKQDDVTHVMLLAGNQAIAGYTGAATKARYFPKYFQSDYQSATENIGAGIYDPQQFDGVRAYTTLNRGKPADYQGVRRCNDVLSAARVPVIDDFARNTEAVAFCDHFELFTRALRGAGSSPTAESWAQAVRRVGSFEGATVNSGDLREEDGKLTGQGTTVALIEWRKSCTCWEKVGDFRKAFG